MTWFSNFSISSFRYIIALSFAAIYLILLKLSSFLWANYSRKYFKKKIPLKLIISFVRSAI